MRVLIVGLSLALYVNGVSVAGAEGGKPKHAAIAIVELWIAAQPLGAELRTPAVVESPHVDNLARTLLVADVDHQEIATAQRLLRDLGLYRGTTNGTLGRRTRKALADYQEKFTLPVTGLPDQRTLYALNNPAAVQACRGSTWLMDDCLAAASRMNRFLEHASPRMQPSASDPVATETCERTQAPVASCLNAVSQMDDWLNRHLVEPGSGSSQRP
jgi:hypothetical protein